MYFILTAERRQYTRFFKFKSTEVNVLSCLICLFVGQNGRFGVMIGQIACQSSSPAKVQLEHQSN